MAATGSTRDWYDGVLPKIVESLGRGFEDAEYELSTPDDSFYLSSTHYVAVRSKSTGKRIDLVVKRPPQHEQMREVIRADSQFHNEILFYRSYADGESGDFPKCFCTDPRPPCDTMIALENVAGRGYVHSPWKYDAPLDYTLAAMREIGRFHARGYVMKERQPEKFFGLVRNIQETRYERASNPRFRVYIDSMSTRAVDHLRANGHDEGFCDKMRSVLGNAYDGIMLRVIEPVEPLATLCHGDFTLNNALFKSDGASRKAMLIDFAMIRYGTPVIDLSTYFCLCAIRDLKKARFTEILRTYHQSLTEYLVDNDVPRMERFSYEAFLDDFKRGALFGFVIASFYLSSLMGHHSIPLERVFEMDIEEVIKIQREEGGEKHSKILADMLLDLHNLGCC